MPATIAFSSPGSRAKGWSGPSIVRSRVKCFSTKAAPSAAAAIGTAIPMVWSERPTGTPNAARIVAIARRLARSGGAG